MLHQKTNLIEVRFTLQGVEGMGEHVLELPSSIYDALHFLTYLFSDSLALLTFNYNFHIEGEKWEEPDKFMQQGIELPPVS